jgi:hypothetical protein
VSPGADVGLNYELRITRPWKSRIMQRERRDCDRDSLFVIRNSLVIIWIDMSFVIFIDQVKQYLLKNLLD